MKERHQATNCTIESVCHPLLQFIKCLQLSCDWKDTNPITVDNYQLFTKCWAQVNCQGNLKRYGYDLYGFYCAQDEIFCNGSKISPSQFNFTDTNFLNSLANCSVVKVSLTFVNCNLISPI